jgi:formylglycine-generating enzyme required for sulfatase activity
VKITWGFWLAKYECTQGQWEAVMGKNPSYFKGGERLPVERVSWLDICGDEKRAGGFLGKVNRDAPAGWRFDLPTEAQWEYA